VLASSFAADKKKQPPFIKHDQTADLNEPKLVNAKQNCENWAFAAGLEAMLKQQEVSLDQNFWVMRISGGELCAPELPSPEALAGVVNREFVLDDGRHVRLELRYSAGVPTNTDALIAGLKLQQVSLLWLHGHTYYLTGATYDEYINSDGSRMFIVTELRLANTFAHEPGLAFVRGRDNMDEITGTVSVSVKTVSQY